MQWWRIMVSPAVTDEQMENLVDGVVFALDVVFGWKLQVSRIRRSDRQYREVWLKSAEPVDMRQVNRVLESTARSLHLRMVDCGEVPVEGESDRPEWWLRLEGE